MSVSIRRSVFACLRPVILGGMVLAAPALALSAQVEGLSTPQSFVADPSGEFYFISNINGDPDVMDNNGFITKLDQSGKIIARSFIHGGNGITLHAPKGMVIVDRVLYVADLGALRGFDTETGNPIVTVSFDGVAGQAKGRTTALADVAYDGTGLLYASDTEANTIYRVDLTRAHAVSALVTAPALAGPAGLAWNRKTGTLVAVSWHKGKIVEITRTGAVSDLVSNSFFSSRFHNLSGVDFDEWGSMYVSDFTAGKVWRIRPDMKFEVIAEFLDSPADLGVDRKNHLILVPYHYANAAEINGLERPNTGGTKKGRSLADYGSDWMKKGPTP